MNEVYFFVGSGEADVCGDSPSFLVPGRPSSGWGNGVRLGVTPQISRAYSAIVRSLENLPHEAIFKMHFFVQAIGS